ncbi:MAG: aminotransferase class I/II-fold pyridoxal phosphate-dependent enzyme [Terriglobia bacterium]
MRECLAAPTLARLAVELSELEARSQLRTLSEAAGISLASNDYLALAQEVRLKQALFDALQSGAAVASTGSRLLSGNHPVWESLEEEFAQFLGVEAALFFSSGYAANLGLLSAVARKEDIFFSDQLNHASLIDGIRLSRARKVIFPHLDLNFLEDHLRRVAGEPGERFIVVESVFSMEGDRAPLTELAELGQKYGAALVVDEAHATGVFGPEGKGLVAEAGLGNAVLASIHTCGKALASTGAFIAGSETLKQYLVNHARTFIFSTAAPPYLAEQIRTALKLVREADHRRARVLSLAASLRQQLRDAGLDCGHSRSQIVPVLLGSNGRALRAAEHLQGAGFDIRAIRPPTVPPGTARLRISLNAGLSEEICERVAQVVATARFLCRGH